MLAHLTEHEFGFLWSSVRRELFLWEQSPAIFVLLASCVCLTVALRPYSHSADNWPEIARTHFAHAGVPVAILSDRARCERARSLVCCLASVPPCVALFCVFFARSLWRPWLVSKPSARVNWSHSGVENTNLPHWNRKYSTRFVHANTNSRPAIDARDHSRKSSAANTLPTR